uniref:NADP-dependent oxidoreductase domain-containing protein n=1 Tax=Bionectria ochroleuca TaxID=29856 RepID=A0A0B7KAJ1_BIOOC
MASPIAPPPLSTVLPPLILGTATFNTQYHPDPTHMPYVSIVREALLTHGITAFDTSPYYGPSEHLLGSALETVETPRSSYLLLTKAGRIDARTFDYSPVAIRASVYRSLHRLRTPYLDLVYAHDAEFVTPQQRFADAGVDVITNASMLSMGLLTTRGVDRGPMASWHPAPPELRRACNGLAQIAQSEGEHLEEVAIRWSMDHWARIGAEFGSTAISHKGESGVRGPARMGISVMGVSSVAELDETYDIWRSVINEESDGREVHRRRKIAALVKDRMWPSLGGWKNYSWPSGRKEYYQRERESHDRETQTESHAGEPRRAEIRYKETHTTRVSGRGPEEDDRKHRDVDDADTDERQGVRPPKKDVTGTPKL